MISETNLYEPRHKARLAIKPGITGMWQVSGRSDITDLYRLLDEEYNADLAAEILRLPQKLAWNYVPNKLNDKTFYSEIIGKSNYERRVF